MKANNIISPKRLFYLLKRDLLNNINTSLIFFGAVTAVIYFISFLTVYNDASSEQLYFSIFANLLFISGFIVTSKIFKEMHRKETTQNYLLLPASNFEKFLSRLLISTIGVAAITIVGVTVISYLSEGINTIIFKRHNQYFNLFNKTVWILFGHYFITQSLFFLGAVYFRKYNFMKTINVIFLFAISISILGTLFTRIVYFDLFEGFFRIKHFSQIIQWENISLSQKTIKTLVNIVKVLYWLIPAPLFWTISYFRIKEAEVTNAI